MPFDDQSPASAGTNPLHPNDLVPVILGHPPKPLVLLKPCEDDSWTEVEFSHDDDAAALAAREGAPILAFDLPDGLTYAVATDVSDESATVLLTGPDGECRSVYVLHEPQPPSDRLDKFYTGVPLFAPDWTIRVVNPDHRFRLADIPTANSAPITWTTGALNDARIIGQPHADMNAVMVRPMTFLLGELWGEKDRRNTQDGDWKAMTLPLRDWIQGAPTNKQKKTAAWGFSRHAEDDVKEGAGWVFGASIDGARKAKAMDTMFCIALDIDAGGTLAHVVDRIQALGLFAIIYTSHSHGTSGLTLKRDDIVKKLGTTGTLSTEDVQTYLRHHAKERYSDDFIAQVKILDEKRQTKDGIKVVVSTPAMEKFRVVFPLKTPVKLIELADRHDEALDIWARKITGLAVETMGVHFDTACTDPSRLFYVPKHAQGRPHETLVIRGKPIAFATIPEMSKTQYARSRTLAQATDPFALAGDDGRSYSIPTVFAPTSGFSLNDWHSQYKSRFELATLIETLCPDKVRVMGGEGEGRIHLECPFEHNHSSDGGGGCMAMNPDVTETEVWTIFCHHDSCQGLHKLEFLEQMLKDDWFEEAALTDDEFLLPPSDEEIEAEEAAQAEADVLAEIGTTEEAVSSYVQKHFSKSSTRDDVKAPFAALCAVGKDGDAVFNLLAEQMAKHTTFKAQKLNPILKEARKEHAKRVIQSGTDPGCCVINRDDFMDQIAASHGFIDVVNGGPQGPQVFRNGNALVRTDAGTDGQSPTIEDLTQDKLSAFLTQHGNYRKVVGDKGETQGVDCPDDVTRFILNQWDLSRFPLLRGLITAPQYTEGGRLIIERGYDEESGYNYVSDFQVEPIPPAPPQAEVDEAKGDYTSSH